MPNAAAVQLGPGKLFVAALGTPEPTSATAALDAAYREIGYTEEGNTFTYSVDTEDIEVDEELDPVRIVVTGRSGSVAFAMAESTRRNLALALNAGAAAANDGTAFEPPTPGTELRVSVVLDTASGARWLFRQCFQSGEIEMRRQKGSKTTIGAEFRLEKPSNAAPFKVFPTADGLI